MEKYMHQKRLDRINELARKQKSERLTEAEKAEQKKEKQLTAKEK